jgi:hypothetical protein
LDHERSVLMKRGQTGWWIRVSGSRNREIFGRRVGISVGRRAGIFGGAAHHQAFEEHVRDLMVPGLIHLLCNRLRKSGCHGKSHCSDGGTELRSFCQITKSQPVQMSFAFHGRVGGLTIPLIPCSACPHDRIPPTPTARSTPPHVVNLLAARREALAGRRAGAGKRESEVAARRAGTYTHGNAVRSTVARPRRTAGSIFGRACIFSAQKPDTGFDWLICSKFARNVEFDVLGI